MVIYVAGLRGELGRRAVKKVKKSAAAPAVDVDQVALLVLCRHPWCPGQSEVILNLASLSVGERAAARRAAAEGTSCARCEAELERRRRAGETNPVLEAPPLEVPKLPGFLQQLIGSGIHVQVELAVEQLEVLRSSDQDRYEAYLAEIRVNAITGPRVSRSPWAEVARRFPLKKAHPTPPRPRAAAS